MTRTVVVVDDQDGLRRLLVVLLGRDRRFRVVAEAADGLAAVAAVEEHDPDLLLLDLGLPRLDGLEVLERLRHRVRPATVVLTGFADEATHQRALALGAYACLVKGQDLQAIPDALDRAGPMPSTG